MGFFLTVVSIKEDKKLKKWPSIMINIHKTHIIIFMISSLWGIAHHGIFNFLPYYFSERVNFGYDLILQGGFLTAFILSFIGSGPIKGFATTLSVGIVCSMFTAIFLTKTIF